MATMTLDELRQDVEQRYGDFIVTLPDSVEVRLRSALRMPKEDRAKLRKLQQRFSDLQDETEGSHDSDEARDPDSIEDDMLEVVRDQIIVLADNKSHARRLLDEIGDDLAMLMGLVQSYMETTMPGEA